MFNNDYFLRVIENLTRGIASILFQKDTDVNQVIDEQGNFSESGFLHQRLKRLLIDRKLNEAENLLYEEVSRQRTDEHLKVAVAFYACLEMMDEETLHECDFSREEIQDGLQSIQALYTR